MASASATDVPLVLVTGVSGYIATWVAAALLHLGYRVRGTVRSLKKKTDFLQDLVPGSRFKLELVEADLTSDSGWAAAVAGCTYVMHVASPFPLETPRDPETELYKPARDGTLHVLRACAEATPHPRRVVLTSSFAAQGFGHPDSDPGPYGDDTWSVTDTNAPDVSPYIRSKVMAERAAWDFLATLPADKKFELAAVNPSTVFGALYAAQQCASAEIAQLMLDRKAPMLPDVGVPCVDLRDVIRAHVTAMTCLEAAGKRFGLNTNQPTMPALGTALAAHFNPMGFHVPTGVVPYWLLWVGGFFSSQMSSLCKMVGKPTGSSTNANATRVLGLTLHTDVHESMRAMALSLVVHGMVKVPDTAAAKAVVAAGRAGIPGFSLDAVCEGLLRAPGA